ncbi:MAG TPA: tetratricopeptide repeat protein [Verrucomicrobiae bacterium]|nr:tetratricopeptide repeat protein [Verrucomicrobiae bacterium]
MNATLSTTRGRYLGALLIALLAVAAHLPGLQGDFVRWDDDTHVTQNVVIRAINPHNLLVMFTQPIAKLYCPITWLSYAVDYQIWGRNPLGYHLTNLLLHVANTLLVLAIVYRLFASAPSPQSSGTSPEQQKVRVSAWAAGLLAAAVFGVHPLRVESVAWITERKDVLFAFFFLLATETYRRWVKGGRRSAYWACLILFILSGLSKSAAVTFPLVALLLDRYWAKRIVWRDKIPFFMVSFIVGATTVMAQVSGPRDAVAGTDLVPVWVRLGLVGYCALFYVRKFLWPFHLCAVYPAWHEMNWTPLRSMGFLIAFGVVTLTIWAVRRRIPILWPCWLFYLCTLSPTIGLLPVGMQVVADRFSYLPLIGLAIPTACGMTSLLSAAQSKPRIISSCLSVGIALLLSFLTLLSVHRTLIWANTETLFQSVLQEHPRCWIAYVKLGSWYRRTQHYDKAVAYGRRAIEIWPAGLLGIKNLAWSLQQAGQPHEAIRVLRPAVERGEDDSEVWLTLSECFVAEGQWQNASAALREAARHPEISRSRIASLRAAVEKHERTVPQGAEPQ